MKFICNECECEGTCDTTTTMCRDAGCDGRGRYVLDGEADFRSALGIHAALTARAEEVAQRFGHGGCSATITFGDTTFTVEWTETWNFGGYEKHSEDVSLHYLWMSDADIDAEIKAKAAAAAEAARVATIAQAEAKAVRARAAIDTAADTARVLAEQAEYELVKLRAGL